MDDIDSDDHDQEVIIIPIKDKTRDLSPSGLGYRTENGVTVIKIDKSINFERHMKAKHSHTCFYCNECGVSKPTRKQLLNHQRSVIC